MPFLDVSKLKKEKGRRERVDFTSAIPSLEFDDNVLKPVQPVQFKLILTNIGNAITVEGSFAVDLEVQCSRCLEHFQLHLEPDFAETYYDLNQQDSSPREEDWVAYTGEAIDINPETQNAIVVNLPMRYICREDCRGLCSGCGIDLNENSCECRKDDVDPRLAKLKDLL